MEICSNQVYAWTFIVCVCLIITFLITAQKTEDLVWSIFFSCMIALILIGILPIGIGFLRGIC